MKHARFFSLLVGGLLLGYGAVAFYFLPLAGFQSELTRLAMLPEREFGWRKPQPALNAAWMTQSRWQDADVLVIGDSFSEGLVWQTVLTRQGLRVRTEHWTAIRGICEDFMPWVRAQGFRGKYVVLEVVERNLQRGLPEALNCQQMQPHFSLLADAPRPTPPVIVDRDPGNYRGRLSIGIQTALTYRDYQHLSDQPQFSDMTLLNGVKAARVPEGCRRFSHRRCEDALFLGLDQAADIAPDVLVAAKKVAARLQGVQLTWAFVPNKSTVYLYPDKHFWRLAAQQLRAPDLLRMSQQALRQGVVDLYPGDNSHFSTEGYLRMGEEIWRAMQQPAP